MAVLEFKGIGITALAAAVPAQVFDNRTLAEYYPAADVEKIIRKTGVRERRFVDDNTTSVDLCAAAARRLMSDADIDPASIDLLIFVSQTPDYRMPASSLLLQESLGLSKDTMAFDLSLGCSAWPYGLAVAYGMVQQHPGIHRALVLDGDMCSRVYSLRDRRTAFLFGDAGSAALIERQAAVGTSTFTFHSDGSLADLIHAEAGGYRMMSSEETVRPRVVDEYGNVRSLEQGTMNGTDVFNFVLKEVPRDIAGLMRLTDTTVADYDYAVFHQANQFINSYLAKKLKLDPERVPTTIEKFGNTSSASIPLTMAVCLREALAGNGRLLLSAFGVGMTWTSVALPYSGVRVSDLVEI